MKKYEYKTVFYAAKEKGLFNSGIDIKQLEQELNYFASEGWKLCTTLNETLIHDLVLIFEREKSVD